MTVRVRPGTPRLEIDGEPEIAAEPLSDSEWEGLEEPEDQTQQNLTKIARAVSRERSSKG